MESSAPAPLGINYLDTLAQQFLEGHDPLAFGTEFHAADGSFPGSLDLQADNIGFQWLPQGADAATLTHNVSVGSDSSGEQHHLPQQAKVATRLSDADPAATSQLAKIRETSRKAQRRYRERQREKLLAAESKVLELTHQLETLRMEKEVLASQAGAATELLQRCSEMQQQQAAAGATSAVQGETQAWWMDDQTRNFMVDSLQLDGNLVLTVDKDAPKIVSYQDLAELPTQDVGGLWRRYLNAYAECLLHWGGNPRSAAGLRLERLYYESGLLWASLQVAHPDRLQEVLRFLTAGDAQPRRSFDGLATEEDRRLAAGARFSPEQKRVLCALRVPLYVNLGRLGARRTPLTAELQGVLPPVEPTSPAASPVGCDVACTSGRFGRILDIMRAMKDTLRDEHCTYLRANFMIWQQIFTCFQGAYLNIQSFPRIVPTFAIAEMIAADAGEPTSEELLQRGAQEPDAELLSVEDVLPPSMRSERAPPPDAGLAA